MARPTQFFNIARISHAFSVLRQTVAEDIRNEDNVDLFTDGTDGLRGFTNVASCTDELWVSIAHGVFTNAAFLYFVDERPACKLVVDDSRVTSQHVNGETHTATR